MRRATSSAAGLMSIAMKRTRMLPDRGDGQAAGAGSDVNGTNGFEVAGLVEELDDREFRVRARDQDALVTSNGSE